MLDKILFWVVLAWMIGMLVMAFFAVRDVIRDDASDSKPDEPSSGDGGAKTDS